MEEGKSFIRVDVSGFDSARWKLYRSKLIDKLYQFLETEIDPIKRTSIGDELSEFTHKLLNYGKAVLDKPIIENNKLLAQIEDIYADIRKKNAEAEAIELKNRLKRFKLFLKSAKIIVGGDQGEEAILFLKDIDQFLLAIREFENESDF